MNESSIADSLGKLLLRLSVAGLMLMHGVHKVLHPDSLGFIGGKLDALGLPTVLAYGVYFGEILGPVLVIFGIFTRIGALLMLVTMIVAILLVHSGELFLLTQHGGWELELQGLYLFGSLAILLMGPGKIALMRD